MEKLKINMMGGGFQHEICSSAGNIPKYLEWDKRGNADISMYIDDAMYWPVDETKKNYAWILESSEYIPGLIRRISNDILQLEDKFELIFTHDKRLVGLSKKMRLTICNAVPWVMDRKIHNKTKLVSMIGSTNKFFGGHIYRHQIMEKFRSQMDCFGVGHNQITNKEEGLNDYCFSIAMENGNYPNIFCEKLTDCFATGTIPIFWGTPTIGEFFNEKGIITLTDDFKIEDLSTDLYYSKMEYIKENFERAINLPTAEDYIYENHIK